MAKKGHIPWNKGLKTSYETRKKQSIARIGKIPWNKNSKGIMKSNSGSFKKGEKRSIKTQFVSATTKGENNVNWKGGVTPLYKKIRKSAEYKLWRKSVFERDNYTCVWCGNKSMKGKMVHLHADHIKPFAYFPELRFAIDNGRTLCISCHKLTETYGEKVKKLYANKR